MAISWVHSATALTTPYAEIVTTPLLYGSQALQITPTGVSEGAYYDFAHAGSYFLEGHDYTASVWLYPSSDMPYRVGFKTAGEDEYATGTATAGIWTQATVTWTPAADYGCVAAGTVEFYVHQTDLATRDVVVNGPRVIPSDAADDFEMVQWVLANEQDAYSTSASLAGTALSALSQLNHLTLSRHFIRPKATTPYYEYVVSGRDELPLKTSVDTFSDDFAGFTEADIDRASIVNVVPIEYAAGGEYYSDADSVGLYGPRPTSAISGAAFFVDRTYPDIIGPALLLRYSNPLARPSMELRADFPRQVERELDDRITLTLTRLGISAEDYLIVRNDTTVSQGGRVWVTVLGLEQWPY